MSLQPSTPGSLAPPSPGATDRDATKHCATARRREGARRLADEVAEAQVLGVAVVVKPAVDQAWTAEEDAVVRALYPDFTRAAARLPHRLRMAIERRAAALDLAPFLKRWTPAEVATLRRLQSGASPAVLKVGLPRWPMNAIDHKARRLGLKPRGRAPLKLTGDPLCDAIRDRCR